MSNRSKIFLGVSTGILILIALLLVSRYCWNKDRKEIKKVDSRESIKKVLQNPETPAMKKSPELEEKISNLLRKKGASSEVEAGDLEIKNKSKQAKLHSTKTFSTSTSPSSNSPAPKELSAEQLVEEIRKLSGAAFEMASAVLEVPSKRVSFAPEAKLKQEQFEILRKEIGRRLQDKDQKAYFHQSGLDELASDHISEGLLDFNYVLVPKSNVISLRLRQFIEVQESKKRSKPQEHRTRS